MNLEDEKRKLRLAVRDGENGEKKLSKTLVTAATPMKSAILKGIYSCFSSLKRNSSSSRCGAFYGKVLPLRLKSTFTN